MNRTVLAVVLLACIPTTTRADIELPRLEGIAVQAFAVVDPQSQIVQYTYQIEHRGTDLSMRWIKLDVRSDETREALSADGLQFDDNFINADIGVAPLCPAYSPTAPPAWGRALTARREIKWSTIQDMLAPGQLRGPFVLFSPCLPGVRVAKAEADLWDFMPATSEASGIGPRDIRQALDAAALQIRTIGPVAPPAPFIPGEFLLEIVQMRAQAEVEGWLRPSSAVDSVDALLAQLGGEIVAESWSAARATAEQAAATVEAISCAGFGCPATQPMTAEARALLAVNLRYLISRLPQVGTPLASTVWLGLKNSDDQGTSFDVRAELFRNGALVAAGETLCITGITRNPNLAKDVRFEIDAPGGVPLASGDVIALKLLTRIGTNPDGTKCPGHSNAVGLRLYYAAASRASGFDGEA